MFWRKRSGIPIRKYHLRVLCRNVNIPKNTPTLPNSVAKKKSSPSDTRSAPSFRDFTLSIYMINTASRFIKTKKATMAWSIGSILFFLYEFELRRTGKFFDTSFFDRSFGAIAKGFGIDQFHRPPGPRILRTESRRIMFLYSSFQIYGNTSIQRLIRTPENIEVVHRLMSYVTIKKYRLLSHLLRSFPITHHQLSQKFR